MNKCFNQVPLALAVLSAHTASFACSRTDFADSNLLGNNYIGDGSEDGGGDKVAVDTSVASTGASTDPVQQDQGANTAPQADDAKADAAEVKTAVGDPQAGAEQQT